MAPASPNWLQLLIEGFQKQLRDLDATTETRHQQNLQSFKELREGIADIKAQIVPVPKLAKEVESLKDERYTRKGILIGLGALGGGGAVAYWKPVLAALGLVKP